MSQAQPLPLILVIHGSPGGWGFTGSPMATPSQVHKGWRSLTPAGRAHGHGVREGLGRLLRRGSPRTSLERESIHCRQGGNISKGRGVTVTELPVPGQPGPHRPARPCNQAHGLPPQAVGAPQHSFGLRPAKLPFLGRALISVSQILKHTLPWSSQSSGILIYHRRKLRKDTVYSNSH